MNRYEIENTTLETKDKYAKKEVMHFNSINNEYSSQTINEHTKDNKFTISEEDRYVSYLLEEIENKSKTLSLLSKKEILLLIKNGCFLEEFSELKNEDVQLALISQGFLTTRYINEGNAKVIVAFISKFGHQLFFQNFSKNINSLDSSILIALLKNGADIENFSEINNTELIVYLVKNQLVNIVKYSEYESIEVKKAIIERNRNYYDLDEVLKNEPLALHYLKIANDEELDYIYYSDISSNNVRKECILNGHQLDINTTTGKKFLQDISFRIECIKANIEVAFISKSYYKCKKTLKALIDCGFSENIIHEETIEDKIIQINVVEQALFLLDDSLLVSIMEFHQDILSEYTKKYTKNQLSFIIRNTTSSELVKHLEDNYNLDTCLSDEYIEIKNKKIISI